MDDGVHKVWREIGQRHQSAGVPVAEPLDPGQLQRAGDLARLQSPTPIARDADGADGTDKLTAVGGKDPIPTQ